RCGNEDRWLLFAGRGIPFGGGYLVFTEAIAQLMVWCSCFKRHRRWSAELVTIKDTGCLPMMDIHIVTDVGNVRTNNEDFALAVYPQSEQGQQECGVLLLLADGMGGHNSGEVASSMAVDGVSQ